MRTFNAGRYIRQGSYKAFVPSGIHRPWRLDSMDLIKMLSLADRQLGRLDMYSEYVHIDLYISMHIVKEATQSSRIEGTRTNIEEAFMKKEDIQPEKRDDWQEVQNYIQAMHTAVHDLQELPFSGRLFRRAHQVLMQGVRGAYKSPGDFRSSQNWIGGATLADAVFIPPPHPAVPDLVSDLEKFANDEDNPLPDLLKIALIHYQFETIHPFLDGNGRVGRLLIPLYLVSKGILKRPILYLSDFFERHRTLYYDNLMRARTHHDLERWFRFFLTGVIETARSGVATFDAILQLKASVDQRIKSLGNRAADASKIIAYLYTNPVVDVAVVREIIQKSGVTAYKRIADLEQMGILREITGGQRGRIYIFEAYVRLFADQE